MAAGQLEGGLSKGAGYRAVRGQRVGRRRATPVQGLLDRRQDGRHRREPARGRSSSTYFADTYEPSGPLGAKGIGEAATNPVAAAYANAIYNAIGRPFLRAADHAGEDPPGPEGADAMTEHPHR